LYQKEGNASAAESIYFGSYLPQTRPFGCLSLTIESGKKGLLFRPSIEISPDIFNAMIEMNVKRQDFAAVEQVLQAMKNRRVVPNVGTFDLLINMYATQGDYKRAIAVRTYHLACLLDVYV
jgi:pentatricopeptide repeat protein